MLSTIDNLNDARLSHRHEEFNRQYLNASNFLTVHTMRFCASVCRQPDTARWSSPLIVLDIDGVLDKQIFGFPSTTAAGIRAVSLLHRHDFAAAVNTARTVQEVKEYCNAYGFAGGVAEYGGAIWDATGSPVTAFLPVVVGAAVMCVLAATVDLSRATRHGRPATSPA